MSGTMRVVAAQVFDGRDQPEIDACLRAAAPRISTARRSGRRIDRDRHRARRPAVSYSDTKPRQGGVGRQRAASSLRTRGVKPAAAMLRRTSSTDVRRRAQRLVVNGRDAIEIVGAERQRHLRELRAVLRPIHLDVLHRRQRQPRQRHRPHIVVAGGRHGDRLLARQRVTVWIAGNCFDDGRADESASSVRPSPVDRASAATGSARAGRQPAHARSAVFGIVQSDRPALRRSHRGRRASAASARRPACPSADRRCRQARSRSATADPPASRFRDQRIGVIERVRQRRFAPRHRGT